MGIYWEYHVKIVSLPICLVVVSTYPSEKYGNSLGLTIPNIWKNMESHEIHVPNHYSQQRSSHPK